MQAPPQFIFNVYYHLLIMHNNGFHCGASIHVHDMVWLYSLTHLVPISKPLSSCQSPPTFAGMACLAWFEGGVFVLDC